MYEGWIAKFLTDYERQYRATPPQVARQRALQSLLGTRPAAARWRPLMWWLGNRLSATGEALQVRARVPSTPDAWRSRPWEQVQSQS